MPTRCSTLFDGRNQFMAAAIKGRQKRRARQNGEPSIDPLISRKLTSGPGGCDFSTLLAELHME
jgi:hypothetical protein